MGHRIILHTTFFLLGISLHGQELLNKVIQTNVESFKKIDRMIQEDEGLSIGEELPPFSLLDITGERYYSSEIMYQSAVIIFWSISSQHCLDLISDLNALKAALPPGIPLISVAMEEAAVIRSHVDNNDYQFKILTNGRRYFRENRWKRLPKTLVVNKEGVIIDVFTSITNGEPKALNEYRERVLSLVKSTTE